MITAVCSQNACLTVLPRAEVSERTSLNEATIDRLETARVRRPQKRTLIVTDD